CLLERLVLGRLLEDVVGEDVLGLELERQRALLRLVLAVNLRELLAADLAVGTDHALLQLGPLGLGAAVELLVAPADVVALLHRLDLVGRYQRQDLRHLRGEERRDVEAGVLRELVGGAQARDQLPGGPVADQALERDQLAPVTRGWRLGRLRCLPRLLVPPPRCSRHGVRSPGSYARITAA